LLYFRLVLDRAGLARESALLVELALLAPESAALVPETSFLEPELAPDESVEVAGLAVSLEVASAFGGALSPSFEVSDFESFFAELYRSEYHPPPRRTKELRLTTFVSFPLVPHAAHRSGGGSFIFCSTSLSFPHLSQTYSYIGMTLCLKVATCNRHGSGLSKYHGSR
jgi:hypothetical protein